MSDNIFKKILEKNLSSTEIDSIFNTFNFTPKIKEVKKLIIYVGQFSGGGVEKLLIPYCKFFCSLDIEVSILCKIPANPSDFFENNHIKVFPIEFTDNFGIKNFQKTIDDVNPDCVLFSGNYSSNIKHMLLYFHSKNIFSIMHFRDFFVESFNRQLKYKFFPYFSAIICQDYYSYQFYNLFNSNVHVIPNIPSTNINVINDNKINKSKYTIIYPAKFDSRKRYFDVIPIAKRVLKEFPNVIFILKGSFTYKEDKIEFLDLIQCNNLSKSVIFDDHFSELNDFYKNASLIISLSESEGFQNTIIESKAYGLPLVTYELVNLDLHAQNKGVIKIPLGDCKKFAKSIIEILKDDDLLTTLSKEAKQSVTEYYNSINFKSLFSKVFSSLKNVSSDTLANNFNKLEKNELQVTSIFHYMSFYKTERDKYRNQLSAKTKKIRKLKKVYNSRSHSIIRDLIAPIRSILKHLLRNVDDVL
jgi:glycosyltransferase involved in cell wall biosynthesis